MQNTQRLVERFDRGNPEAHFFELTKLKKIGNLETYMLEQGLLRAAKLVQF